MLMPEQPLPASPKQLSFDLVTLHFSEIVPGHTDLGFVPFYHYRIFVNSADVGHINLRIGNTEHVQFYAGHVGYEITAPHRGHRYALQACLALAPFARLISPEHVITCDPDNYASHRTIELLGTRFIDEVPVSIHDPNYFRGSRIKQRFLWYP
jgi:predicted acetyltransferase